MPRRALGVADSAGIGRRETGVSEETSAMAEESRAQRLGRLRYRSWHRGMREMDLLLGPFADRHLEELDEATLVGYERLLELPDPQLFVWLSGRTAVPQEVDSPALRHVIDFCHRRFTT